MFVLDVLRRADSYDAILRTINDHHRAGWRDEWGCEFLPSEIDDALDELKQRGLVVDREDAPNFYEITDSGRAAWNQWIPPGPAGERVVISRLLMQWDPIGVLGGSSDWPQDEYDGYVSPVVSALRSGASEPEIAKLLERFRTDHMSLPPSPGEDTATARQATLAWDKLTANQKRQT